MQTEGVFRDRVTRSRHEQQQDVDVPIRQRNRLAVAQKTTRLRVELKRSEGMRHLLK